MALTVSMAHHRFLRWEVSNFDTESSLVHERQSGPRWRMSVKRSGGAIPAASGPGPIDCSPASSVGSRRGGAVLGVGGRGLRCQVGTGGMLTGGGCRRSSCFGCRCECSLGRLGSFACESFGFVALDPAQLLLSELPREGGDRLCQVGGFRRIHA